MRRTPVSSSTSAPAAVSASARPVADGVHPTFGDEHPLDRVHVGDDGVQRKRLVRRHAGVQRLEREHALQSLVVEERCDLATQPSEPTECGKSSGRPPPTRQIEHRVEVGVDEVRHLDAVELREPVGEPLERIRRPELRRTGRSPHPSRRVHDARRARIRRRTVARYIGSTGLQRTYDAMSRPAAANTSCKQTRHRQHGRPVVQSEAIALDEARPPARAVASLQHGHVVPIADQVGGRRKAAQTGADDRDAHGSDSAADDVRGQVGELTPGPRPAGRPRRARRRPRRPARRCATRRQPARRCR